MRLQRFSSEIKFALVSGAACALALAWVFAADHEPPCPTPERVGTLLSGRAQVGGRWLQSGDALFVGDTLRTGDGSGTEVRLDQGEILSPGADTELRLGPTGACSMRDTVTLTRGELRVRGRTRRVLWIASGARKFEFINGDAALKTAGESITTRVFAGSLVVTGPQGRQVLSSRQEAKVRDSVTVNNLVVRPLVPEADGIVLSAGRGARVRFQWEFTRDGAVYLDLGREANFANPLFSQEVGDSQTRLDLQTGLYYWRLRALNADGKPIETGETRAFRVLNVAPPVAVGPVGGRKIEITGSRAPVQFRWRFAMPEVPFRLEVATDRSFKTIVMTKETRSPAATLALPGGTYWWRVSAGQGAAEDGLTGEPARFNVGTAGDLAKIGLNVRSPRGGRRIDPTERDGIAFYWKSSPVFERFRLELFHYDGRLGARVFKVKTDRRDYFFDRAARLRPGSYRWVVTGYQEAGLSAQDHGDFTIVLPPVPAPPRVVAPGKASPDFDSFKPTPGRGNLRPPGNSEFKILGPPGGR